MAKALSKYLDDDYFDELPEALRTHGATLFDDALDMTKYVDKSPTVAESFDNVVSILPNVLGAELHATLEAERESRRFREEVATTFKMPVKYLFGEAEISIGGVAISGFGEDGGIEYRFEP